MANRPDTLAYGAFAVAEDGTLYAGNNTNAAVEQAKQATLAQEITDRAADTATCLRSSAQTLTVEQQTQARTNIGAASAASAASAADLTTETNERITADTGVRGLTATVEATSTASQAYAIGAYFVYNGLLYKCTVAIAKGGTITPGTNCTATTAGAEISTLNQNLTVKEYSGAGFVLYKNDTTVKFCSTGYSTPGETAIPSEYRPKVDVFAPCYLSGGTINYALFSATGKISIGNSGDMTTTFISSISWITA